MGLVGGIIDSLIELLSGANKISHKRTRNRAKLDNKDLDVYSLPKSTKTVYKSNNEQYNRKKLIKRYKR